MKYIALFVLILLPAFTAVQGIRFSSTVTAQGTVGPSTNVVVLPSSPQIAFCNHPANAVPCTNKATTYTDQTVASTCSTSSQIVRDGTNICVASPDSQNNWGVWVAPKTAGYDYTSALSGGVSLSPFNVLSQTTTHRGTETFTGAINCTVVNAVRCISPTNPQGWAGSDAAAWIASAATNCGSCKIQVAAGTYTVSAGQTIPQSNITIEGDGPTVTVFSVNFVSGDVFNFTGSGIAVRNVRFIAGVTRTGGAYVHFNGVTPCFLENFTMDGAYLGAQLTNTNACRIHSGITSDAATTTGASEILVDGTTGNDQYIDNITMNAPGGSQPPAGIAVQNTGSLQVWNVDVIHHGTDLLVNPGNGQSVSAMYVADSFFDTANNGISIVPTGTGNVTRVRFLGTWSSSHTNNGITLNNTGTGSCDAIEFIGHHALLNAGQGLFDQAGCTNVQVIGGLYSANTNNGLAFAAGVGSFQVHGVKSGSSGLLAGNGGNGLRVVSGSSDNYQITGNDFRGNTGPGLSDGGTGTNKQVFGNLPLNSSMNLAGAGNVRASLEIADQGTPCTNGELALSAGWQSTGSATVTAVSGNGQTCSWTITTGTTTAANPTITDTLTNALPAATTVCEMNIHGGTHTAAAGEGFQQTTLSATAPIFTFNGTPTAGGTTYFITRRCGP